MEDALRNLVEEMRVIAGVGSLRTRRVRNPDTMHMRTNHLVLIVRVYVNDEQIRFSWHVLFLRAGHVDGKPRRKTFAFLANNSLPGSVFNIIFTFVVTNRLRYCFHLRCGPNQNAVCRKKSCKVSCKSQDGCATCDEDDSSMFLVAT